LLSAFGVAAAMGGSRLLGSSGQRFFTLIAPAGKNPTSGRTMMTVAPPPRPVLKS